MELKEAITIINDKINSYDDNGNLIIRFDQLGNKLILCISPETITDPDQVERYNIEVKEKYELDSLKTLVNSIQNDLMKDKEYEVMFSEDFGSHDNLRFFIEKESSIILVSVETNTLGAYEYFTEIWEEHTKSKSINNNALIHPGK